jgi:hypothetical protein
MARATEDVWVLGVGEARRLLTFLVVGDGSSTYAGLERLGDGKPGLDSVLDYRINWNISPPRYFSALMEAIYI